MSDIRYYSDGERANAAVLNRPLGDLEKQSQYMSEVQFEALRTERRRSYGQSGLINGAATQYAAAVNSNFMGFNDIDQKSGLATIKRDTAATSANATDVVILDWNATHTNENHRNIFHVDGQNIVVVAPHSTDSFGSTGKLQFPPAPTVAGRETNIRSLSKDYAQGEFFILDDTTTEYVPSFAASAWTTQANISVSDNGSTVEIANIAGTSDNAYFGIPITVNKGVRYRMEITFDAFNANLFGVGGIWASTNRILVADGVTGTQTIEFYAWDNTIYIQGFQASQTPSVISSLSLMQIEEAVISVYNALSAGSNLIDQQAVVVPNVSRQDIGFLEVWHELVTDRDFVYPYGSTQYSAKDVDGLNGIADGTFSDASTYSLYGRWQADGAVVGKGYVWSSLSETQKLMFASNPDNNIYLTKDGLVQVRYRLRSIGGLGDNWDGFLAEWTSNTFSFKDPNFRVRTWGKRAALTDYIGNHVDSCNTTGNTEERSLATYKLWTTSANHNTYGNYRDNYSIIPLVRVQRLNDGAYDPFYNIMGTAKFADGAEWDATTSTRNSTYDCFTNAGSSLVADGNSGRPDGNFSDHIERRQVHDLRYVAHKVGDGKEVLANTIDKILNGLFSTPEGSLFKLRYAGRVKADGPNNTARRRLLRINGTFSTKEWAKRGLRANQNFILVSADAGNNNFAYCRYDNQSGHYIQGVINQAHWPSTHNSETLSTTAHLFIVEGKESIANNRAPFYDGSIPTGDIIGDPATYPPILSTLGFEAWPHTRNSDGSDVVWAVDNTYNYVSYVKLRRIAISGGKLTAIHNTTGAIKTCKIYLDPWSGSSADFVNQSSNPGNANYIGDGLITAAIETDDNTLYITKNATFDPNDYTIIANYSTPTQGWSHTNGSDKPILAYSDHVIGISGRSRPGQYFGKLAEIAINKPFGASFTNKDVIFKNITNLPMTADKHFPREVSGGYLEHGKMNLSTNQGTVGVKILPYLSVVYGSVYFNIWFNEMIYSTTSDRNDIVDITTDLPIGPQTAQLVRFTHANAGQMQHVIIERTHSLNGWTATMLSSNTYIVDGVIYRVDDGTTIGRVWDGDGWGDDGLMKNPVYMSRYTDENNNRFAAGIKSVKLPYYVNEAVLDKNQY